MTGAGLEMAPRPSLFLRLQLAQAALTRRWLARRFPAGTRRRTDRPKH